MIEFAAVKKLMESQELLKILELVKEKKLSPDEALQRVKHLPFEDLDFAKVDHHRALRQGFAEVVFAKGKTVGQVAEIVKAMLRKKDSRHNVLITRADAKVFAAVKRISKGAEFHPLSGVITNHHRTKWSEDWKGNHRRGVGRNERHSRRGRGIAHGADHGK